MGVLPFQRRGVSEWFEYISPRLHMEIGPHYGRGDFFFEMQQDIGRSWPLWKTCDYVRGGSLAEIIRYIEKTYGFKVVLFLGAKNKNCPSRTVDYETLWLTEFCNA